MNNYKNELTNKWGNGYRVAIMKTARRIIDGRQEKPYAVSENLALAIMAVLVDRNKNKLTVNKPGTIDFKDLRVLDWKVGTNTTDNQIFFTY
jgi:hypothetical protein